MRSTRHHNVWIDGAACFWTSSIVAFVPVLRSPRVARLVLDIMDKYRKRYGVKIIGYVIMPNHIHLVVWSEKAEDAKRFISQVLARSSKQIAEVVSLAAERGSPTARMWLNVFERHAGSGARIAVWQERGRAFPVTLGHGLRQKLDYIHANPVRKGLAANAEEYIFSSAAWYRDGTGPMVMDEVEGW